MSDPLTIQSHAGTYTAVFDDDALHRLNGAVPTGVHVIVDRNVARLYRHDMDRILASPSVLEIEASEASKSLERFPAYVAHLVAHAVRRHHRLVAIGGGVIQDITSFLAATLLRGMEWEFFPTTLLAQADSCIGSKSSINVGSTKNILGTFTPPARITIVPCVLKTLSEQDRRSGVGEMLKVHAVAGPDEFDRIAADYPRLFADAGIMQQYIRRSLEFKKRIIEIDEFDRGPRQVMNYGHTFGHAIEAATDYAVPHGIAVTMGMDMANFVAMQLGIAPPAQFERMHTVLRRNYAGFERLAIPPDQVVSAIARDKKNTDREVSLILPDAGGRLGVVRRQPDARFSTACAAYLSSARAVAT